MLTPSDIIEFWFDQKHEGQGVWAEQLIKWNNVGGLSADFITVHLKPLVDAAQKGELDHWMNDAKGCLALILLCDVFTRFIYAGQNEAFQNDAKACAVLQHALEAGMDAQWTILQRLHAYLPFEHAEDAKLQSLSVDLYAKAHQDATNGDSQWTSAALSMALAHQGVIKRFGRFPQRNAMLGRHSTPEEQAFLVGLMAHIQLQSQPMDKSS